MRLKESLRSLAKEKYMDYFGIAPVERWDNAPAGHRPQDFVPNAKSVISMGIKVRAGAKHANRLAYENRDMKMAIAIYMQFGFQILNELLDKASYFIHRELIEKGFFAIPMPTTHPYPYITEVVFDETKPTNLFSNRHAAVAAGNADFGWNTLALTPEAGPRVRWVSVITEAEIEPDELYNGDPICSKCPKPKLCAKVCPMNALDLEKNRSLEIEGKTFSYSRIERKNCIWGICGLTKANLGTKDCYMPEERTLDAFYQALSEQDPILRQERFGNGSMCGKCIIYCPIGEDN